MTPRSPRPDLAELDRTSWPEFRDTVAGYEPGPDDGQPRSHPGLTRVELPAIAFRRRASLERALACRRSGRAFEPGTPPLERLARLLKFSHGLTGQGGAGPAPSAGGLAGLELYLVVMAPGDPPPGAYHYDRTAHALARLADSAPRTDWIARVPSLADAPDAPLMVVLAGDGARQERKYGPRGHRFLLVEAGHLMQNVLLMAASLRLAALPLGGLLEAEIARALALPRGDRVLHAAAIGMAKKD